MSNGTVGGPDPGPQFREVDPGELRLPPSRAGGADPWKLHDQIRQYGASKAGMPAIFVSETPTAC